MIFEKQRNLSYFITKPQLELTRIFPHTTVTYVPASCNDGCDGQETESQKTYVDIWMQKRTLYEYFSQKTDAYLYNGKRLNSYHCYGFGILFPEDMAPTGQMSIQRWQPTQRFPRMDGLRVSESNFIA